MFGMCLLDYFLYFFIYFVQGRCYTFMSDSFMLSNIFEMFFMTPNYHNNHLKMY